ncbi:GAF domain-containing protein [Bosea sp. (in: a-proteobacteria)]|jgi:GAF domain-containing protein|uniref:GAF domain-containing protein n=1 Tax=Bosea sp. (in: a-proteobacteria) TaxID=1871050 RepID=UPI003F6F5BEC
MAEPDTLFAIWPELCRHAAKLAWGLGEGPAAAFAAADQAAERLVARSYSTILRLDEGGLSCRLFSSVPQAYPVGVAKPLGSSPWRDRVVDRAEVFIAETPAEIAVHFPDFELVGSLGGRCLANIPVPGANGRIVGLFNVAGGRAFTPSELRLLQLIGNLLGPAVAAAPPN